VSFKEKGRNRPAGKLDGLERKRKRYRRLGKQRERENRHGHSCSKSKKRRKKSRYPLRRKKRNTAELFDRGKRTRPVFFVRKDGRGQKRRRGTSPDELCGK